MVRGFLSGVMIGTVVAGAGAGVLSLLVGAPDPIAKAPAPEAALEAPPTGQDAPSDQATQTAIATDAPEKVAVSGTDAPEQAPAPTPDAEEIGSAAFKAAPTPETGDADGAAEAPRESEMPSVEAANAPPEAAAPTEALDSPEIDADVAVETTPSEQTESVTPAEEPAKETVDAPGVAPTSEEGTVAEAPPSPEPLPDEAREEITLEIAPEPEPEQPAVRRTTPGTPASTLGSSASSRLPTVQSAVTSAPESAEKPSAEADPSAPPFKAFAAAFEGDDSKAKMAIVLIDDGTSNIGVEALTTFPYPLSFAVDTSWKGAKDAMASYRASGFEVLAMVDLPRGARASDVEVNMPILLANVPEAVGVIETPDAGLQESRDVTAQVTEYLAGTGHGLLFFPKGLNTAQKVAAKEGVPSATVFRDFDAKGQNASAIKRFLNHAALKASNEGGVVMVGRLRADTISALLLWGLQDRSDRLQLAPVSRLMSAAE